MQKASFPAVSKERDRETRQGRAEKESERSRAVEKEVEKAGEPRQMERGIRGPEGKGK